VYISGLNVYVVTENFSHTICIFCMSREVVIEVLRCDGPDAAKCRSLVLLAIGLFMRIRTLAVTTIANTERLHQASVSRVSPGRDTELVVDLERILRMFH